MSKEIKNDLKETLVKYAGEIGDNYKFWSQIDNKKKSNSEKIGNTNIRDLAVTALNTECYKELELFIQYKTAKGNGWDSIYEENTKFGEKITYYMGEIRRLSGKDDKEALKNISKFFGYLYWNKKVMEKKLEEGYHASR